MKREFALALGIVIVFLGALGVWTYDNYSSGNEPKDSGNQPKDSGNQPKEKTVVFDLPARIAYFADDGFSPCYFDRKNATLYRWKGVALRREQVPNAGPFGRIPVLIAKDFTVTVVEAPVKYRLVDGKYRPGYSYLSGPLFIEWKGVMMRERELLEKSADSLPAILPPDKMSVPAIEIDMPVFLKEHPWLWKKVRGI